MATSSPAVEARGEHAFSMDNHSRPRLGVWHTNASAVV